MPGNPSPWPNNGGGTVRVGDALDASATVAAVLKATLGTTRDGLLVVDRDGQVIAYNDALLELWEIPRDVASDLDGPDLLAALTDRCHEFGHGWSPGNGLEQQPSRTDARLIRLEDDRVLEHWTHAFGIQGEAWGRVFAFRPVPGPHAAPRSPQETSGQAHVTVQTSPVSIFTLDTDQRITSWNATASQFLEADPEEVLGRRFSELVVAPDDGVDLSEHVGTALAGHRRADVEVTFEPPGGRRGPRDARASFAPLEAGDEVVGVVVTAQADASTLGTPHPHDRSKARMTTWWEMTDDLVVTIDNQGRIGSLSPAFMAATGGTRDRWVARPFTELIHPEDREAALDRYQDALDDVEPPPTACRYEARDGTWRVAHLQAQPVVHEGKTLEVLALLREIDGQRHPNGEQRKPQGRRAEIEHLKQKAQERQELIATTAHELSKPLTPMRFQLATLQMILEREEQHDTSGREVVGGLERSLARLERLVDDLTQASEAEREAFSIDPETVRLADVVDPVASSYRLAAEEKGLRIEIVQGAPAIVRVDPQRLEQVAANLVENAIKFTEPGGTIRVEIDRAGGCGNLEITDSGQGISGAQLQRLFNPFSPIHGEQGRASGSGLGLYVSKSIVEAHGGRIWCESPGPGQGATFHVELPLAQAGDRSAEVS